MYRQPASFQKGMRIIRNNRYSVLSRLMIDEQLYMRMPVMKRGKGPYLYDYDENRFVDFELGEGNLLLGHAPPYLTSVMKAWLGRGFSSGYSSSSHRLLSKSIHEVIYKKSENDLQFIYADSVYQAAAMLLEHLSKEGKQSRGVYVHNRKKNTQGIDDAPIFYHSLKASRIDEIEDLNTDIMDCAVVRVDKSVMREPFTMP